MPKTRKRIFEIEVPGQRDAEPSSGLKAITQKGCDFTALELEREPVTGALWFNRESLVAFCRVNDQNPARVLADLDLACCFIALWYCLHRQGGGAPDMVAEQIVAEVVANDDAGGQIPRDAAALVH
ncbi:MAG: hypothetical protein ABI831_24410 [Betaproteobacteria bacterium]